MSERITEHLAILIHSYAYVACACDLYRQLREQGAKAGIYAIDYGALCDRLEALLDELGVEGHTDEMVHTIFRAGVSDFSGDLGVASCINPN